MRQGRSDQHTSPDPAPPAAAKSTHHVDVDFGIYEPRHRFDAYQSFFENVDHVKLRSDSAESLHAYVKAWNVQSSLIGRYSRPSSYLVRDRPLLKKTVSEFALVRLYVSGISRAIIDGRVAEMRPGTLFIWDVQCEISEMTDDAVYLGAGIPFSKIGFDPGRHALPLMFRAETPAGRMLATAFETIHTIVPESSAADAAIALDGFCAMLKAILSGHTEEDSEDLARGREAVVRRYLEKHWADHSLTAAKVCSELGLSRAVLYRMRFLSDAGGFEAYLRRRRMEAAMIALSGHPPERGAVARICEQQGFIDQASFTKQFRRTFACSPGEVVGLSVPGVSGSPRTMDWQPPGNDGSIRTLMGLYSA